MNPTLLKWLKVIGMAAVAAAAQLATNRVTRQPGAPPITGGNLAAAAGTAAVMAAITHVMESPLQQAPQTFDAVRTPDADSARFLAREEINSRYGSLYPGAPVPGFVKE